MGEFSEEKRWHEIWDVKFPNDFNRLTAFFALKSLTGSLPALFILQYNFTYF